MLETTHGTPGRDSLRPGHEVSVHCGGAGGHGLGRTPSKTSGTGPLQRARRHVCYHCDLLAFLGWGAGGQACNGEGEMAPASPGWEGGRGGRLLASPQPVCAGGRQGAHTSGRPGRPAHTLGLVQGMGGFVQASLGSLTTPWGLCRGHAGCH